jgi:hypothetical protein
MSMIEIIVPEATSPCWCGDQATALTAAVWSSKRHIGSDELLCAASHTYSLLFNSRVVIDDNSNYDGDYDDNLIDNHILCCKKVYKSENSLIMGYVHK